MIAHRAPKAVLKRKNTSTPGALKINTPEPSSPELDLPEFSLRDEAFLREAIRFTRRSFATTSPVPFGAIIVHTRTGEVLQRAVNAVARERDPSSHAELRAVRMACKKIKGPSLAGYTMYSTCEPCPMCIANAMWAGLDRVVYGATIEDASRHCDQIHIPAKEVAARSDIPCTVQGPFLRDLCYALFTSPRMLAAFSTRADRGKSQPDQAAAPKPKSSAKKSSRPPKSQTNPSGKV